MSVSRRRCCLVNLPVIALVKLLLQTTCSNRWNFYSEGTLSWESLQSKSSAVGKYLQTYWHPSCKLLVTAAICWWPRFSIHTKVFSVYLATNFIWQLPATTHQLLWDKTLTVTDQFRSNCEQLPTTTHQSTVLQAHIRPNRMCSFILKLIFDFIQPHNFDFWHEVMSLMLAWLNAMFLLTALKH